jgi:hypothetical protein
MIHVFAAQYYNIYRNNHRIEQIHLMEAEVSLHPILPLTFSICCRGLVAEGVGPNRVFFISLDCVLVRCVYAAQAPHL